MTLNETIDLEMVSNLYEKLTRELTNINEQDMLSRLTEGIQISETFIRQLRNYATSRRYSSLEDQVVFFKNLKPKFYSHLFYYSEIYNIEIGNSSTSTQAQRLYFKKEMERIKMEYEEHKEFYTYLSTGQTKSDTYFFVLGRKEVSSLHQFYRGLNSRYSTGYDLLVAKYWAIDKMANYLSRRIFLLEQEFHFHWLRPLM